MPPPTRPTPAGAVSALTRLGLGFRVTPANVIAVRNAIGGEAARLQHFLTAYAADLQIADCGPDPISQHATIAFNEKIQKTVNSCTAYIEELRNASQDLEAIAKAYGHGEEAIAQSFADYINEGRTRWAKQQRIGDAVASLPEPLRELVQPPPTAATPPSTSQFPGMIGLT